MERSCCNCKYRERAMGDSHCLDCVSVKCSENDVGHVYKNFELIHVCSTCKHLKKKVTEEPCMDCDNRPRSYKDRWEAAE